jgi:hypothetical protein
VHSEKRIIEGKRFGPPVPTFRGPLGHRTSQSKSQSLSNPTSTKLNRILESLAHIFALQAFHQYQYNRKKEKHKMPSATPTIPVSNKSSRLHKRTELTAASVIRMPASLAQNLRRFTPLLQSHPLGLGDGQQRRQEQQSTRSLTGMNMHSMYILEKRNITLFYNE